MANNFEPDGAEEVPMFLPPDMEVQQADEGTISYVFPVEVIVVGALTEDDHREIYQRVWNDFGEAMAYQSA